MKKKSETEALKEAIILMQNKQENDLALLKEQFHLSAEKLKPANLIKGAISNVSPGDIKNSLINNALGLTTGYLSRKVLLGATHHPVKKILGTLVQFAVAGLVAKNSDTIRSKGMDLFRALLGKKDRAAEPEMQPE
jgi:hypothetical protein